jgi:hypothetical protein
MKIIALTITLGAVVALGAACTGDTCDPNEPGIICTIAGSGSNGYDRLADTMPVPALETRFSLPQDILAAPDGTLYILDWNNHRLRKLTTDGMVEWIVGQGELGGSLDDPALNDFNHPTNLIWDATGENIIIAAWHNSKIRMVNASTHAITDSCGTGGRAYFGDGGPAAMAVLDLPTAVALDPSNNIVIMDQANQVIRRIDAAGNIDRIAGRCIVDAPPPVGPGACPAGVEPTQCPDGPMGPSGKFTCGDPMVYCGRPCWGGYTGDDIPATDMRMSQPFGQAATPAGRILYDPEGNLIFADTANHLIRMIDTTGTVRRLAGQPPVDGMPQRGYTGDGGPAVDALINYPVDIALADDGTLYFTDVQNHCVRAIAPDGTIDTVVGICGQHGYTGDGGPPAEALLNLAFGLHWANGRLYIADTGNSVIRSVLLD